MLTSLVAALALAAPPEVPSPSLVGSGLFTIPDTSTLPRGRFTLAAGIDNKDRDPLGIDVFDAQVLGAVGVSSRVELYGHFVFSRVISLPEVPTNPPPPLDLIVPTGTPVPARPYYSAYTQSPYVNHRGDVRFDAFTPGDLVLGAKMRLVEADGGRPAFALAFELRPPVTRERHSLESGSSAGSFDVALRAIGERRWGRFALVGHAAYTRVGSTPDGDRIVSANATTASVVEEPLVMPDRLDLGLGARYALSPRFSLLAETTLELTVGSHTPLLDAIAPFDVLGGVQGRLGPVRVTLALRYHGHDAPSGALEPAPLAGYVDLTDTSDDDARRYLQAVGLGGAAAGLRSGVQRAVLPARAGVALPTGARVIPPTYDIRSEHQFGSVILFGWSF